jgi:PAS domain S-box-containing protein
MMGNHSQSPLSSIQLRQTPERFEHIMGLGVSDFDALLQSLGDNINEPQRSSTEKLAEEVSIALLFMRQSMSQEVLSVRFGIEETEVGDIINRLLSRLEATQAPYHKSSSAIRSRKHLLDSQKNKNEVDRLLQELQIHQVELQAQNEELRTSRAETEEQLLRYTKLYEFAPMGYFTVVRNGKTIQNANLAAERLMGLSRREFLDQPFIRFIEEESHSVVVGLLAKTFDGSASDEPLGCDVKMVGKGQKSFWAHIKAVVSADMQLCRIAVLDITASKETEEALRKSEAVFRSALQSLSEGIVVQDTTSAIQLCNPQAEHILGLTVEQMMGRTSLDPRWRSIHEDGSPFPGETHPVPIALKTGLSQHNVIMGVHKPDDSLSWISINAEPIFFEGETEIRGAIATFTDVTERKKAEELLKASFRDVKNFRMALEAATLISITDIEGTILYANEHFAALSQFSAQELIGNNHRMINSGYHDTEFFKNMWQTIKSGKPWRGEIRNRAKDGSNYWVEAVICPMFDEHGEVYQYMAVRYDITTRKKSEDALRLSQEQFRSIIDVSPVPYALNDEEGNITYLNPAFIQTFGYDLNDIPTLTEWWLCAYPDAEYRKWIMEKWRGDLEKAEQHHQPFEELEVEIRCKDGGHRSILVSAAAIGGTFKGTHLVILYDFTDRKRAEALLAASEERYRSFVELQGTYFLRTDLEGKYTYASPAHIQTFGMGKTSVVGLSGLEHIIPEDHPKTFRAVEQCLQNPGTAVSVVLRKPSTSGNIMWTEWEFITIQNADGVVTEVQSVGHDITERKLAEEKLHELNQTLEERVEKRTRELVLLNNEKNEFLGIAAHDLKNPLSGILSSAEILERYFGGEAQSKRYVSMIVSASEQMLDIIENLLDVNKIESGLLKVHIIPISLEVVAAVVEDYQQRATSKGIILRYEPAADEPVPTVLADEQALWQVMDNLISNAVKYSPHWKTVNARVLSRTDAEGKRFGRVEIQDEGPGISEADMHKLFAKFTRLTAQPTGGENSTGLGLSIVKKLVELQQGQVWCESELGKGATFIVEFPCA